jgi:hypothetical protein
MARRFPDQHFVLAVAGARESDNQIAELLARWRALANGEILIDPPRAQVVALHGGAGIYLHTGITEDNSSRPGMPISIAEAMATGAHILLPDRNPWAGQIGDAGRAYRNTDQAARLLRESANWSDAQWHQAWVRSINRSFRYFADELVLRPLFDDWCAILAQRGVA